MRFSFLLFSYLLSCLLAQQSIAQASMCPYEYFSLRSDILSRNYFSFRLQSEKDIRLTYGTFSDLKDFYQKYRRSMHGPYEDVEIVHELNSGFILKSTIPLDSLHFFRFASDTQIRTVDAVAKKGEKYFVNHFFNEFGCIKQEFDNYEPAIMKWLQAWCIAASQDSETGYMIITYKFSPLIR